MVDAATLLTGAGASVLGWIGLNLFGKPILALREKRREALEAGQRYAYVGLRSEPDSEYRKRALAALHDAGNALLGFSHERSLATQLYCWKFGYDLCLAGRALLGLGKMARGQYSFSETTRRQTLHALFVALGATYDLSEDELLIVRKEIAQWHEGKHDLP